MNEFFAAKIVLLIVCLTLALYYDLKEQKVKNFITLPMALAGVLLNAMEQGTAGLLWSLKGWMVPMLMLIVLYYINVMGAGDIKLYGSIGAVMGLPFVAYSFVYSIYFGALFALIVLARRRCFVVKMKQILCYLGTLLLTRRLSIYSEKNNKSSKFVFTTAIVPGALVHLIFSS